MKVDVLLGLQWGDEGKGKIVDVLTPDYNVICRFQGGPNAGHSLKFNDINHVLHSIPSGIFRENTMNIIGNGMVLDPIIFQKEIQKITDLNIDIYKKLQISKKAHLILPSHRILDAASEAAKGKTKIGSTLKGIGPTYMDKTGRNGLRVGDILADNFKEKYQFLVQKHQQILRQYDFEYNLEEFEKDWFAGIEELKKFDLIDSSYQVNHLLNQNQKILAEGAQGTLLDIEFGSYPYVTSSNTITAGACIGLGISPQKIGDVFGIFKAYCTRVGSGPFPSELFDETGKKIQKNGHEFGATTGRPRRCGWLDLTALKYAIMLNGITQLIMTKADVLSFFETIKTAIGYELIDGTTTDKLPYNMEQIKKPIYKEFKGWDKDISGIKKYSELPKELIDYVQFIEKETNVPVKIVSVGPDRSETIFKN